MTRCPTWFDRYVCTTPMTPVAIAMPIMPSTRMLSSAVSRSGIATSSVSRSRNGDSIPSRAEIRIRKRTPPSGRP
jgi:hypothetical protein